MSGYFGPRICKDLGIAFDDAGKSVLEDVFGLKNETTKDLISTTNYFPKYLVAGTVFIYRTEKPYHYKLWMAAMHRDPVYELDAKSLVSLTPYDYYKVKNLPEDPPPPGPRHFMGETETEEPTLASAREDVQPKVPEPLAKPKKTFAELFRKDPKDSASEKQQPLRTTTSIADFQTPEGASKTPPVATTASVSDCLSYQDRVIKILWDRCDELEELVVPPEKYPQWYFSDSENDEL